MAYVLDPAAMGAGDEVADCHIGDVRQPGLLYQATGNSFRCLVVQQVFFYKVSQFFVLHNFHALKLGVLAPHIRFVLGLPGVITAFDFVPTKLVGDG